jgi:hypothetical protein
MLSSSSPLLLLLLLLAAACLEKANQISSQHRKGRVNSSAFIHHL